MIVHQLPSPISDIVTLPGGGWLVEVGNRKVFRVVAGEAPEEFDKDNKRESVIGFTNYRTDPGSGGKLRLLVKQRRRRHVSVYDTLFYLGRDGRRSAKDNAPPKGECLPSKRFFGMAVDARMLEKNSVRRNWLLVALSLSGIRNHGVILIDTETRANVCLETPTAVSRITFSADGLTAVADRRACDFVIGTPADPNPSIVVIDNPLV